MYKRFKIKEIEERYFNLKMLESILNKYNFNQEVKGYSFENRPIYLLKSGYGEKKIILWAQMHGNETTASRACLDLFSFLNSDNKDAEQIKKNLTIHCIPMLNPDGAERYTRRNAAGIDLNRDFVSASTPEIQLLKKLMFTNVYSMVFNLHDQRTIFHPLNNDKPATISLLSPSYNVNRDLNSVREQGMRIIEYVYKCINNQIPNQIARFSDEFYPRAVGDNLQKEGISTILIESGHYQNDYKRNKSREFTFWALYHALIGLSNKVEVEGNYDDYFKIPKNSDTARDIIFRDVNLKYGDNIIRTDIAIQFEEQLNLQTNSIDFVAKINEIGDLSYLFGYDEYHVENRIFSNSMNQLPKIGDIANFNLGDWTIRNGKKV